MPARKLSRAHLTQASGKGSLEAHSKVLGKLPPDYKSLIIIEHDPRLYLLKGARAAETALPRRVKLANGYAG
jgi:hypothetical protein